MVESAPFRREPPFAMSVPTQIVIASANPALPSGRPNMSATAFPPSIRAAVTILGMTTQGDQILDRPLAQIGGKGLFIKELEVAMAEGRANLAVHSMKDVPMVMPGVSFSPPFRLARIPAMPSYRAVMPASTNCRRGCRRDFQLAARSDPAGPLSATGNPQFAGQSRHRLRKLDEGQYDAIILAAAGLIRLGLKARIRALLTPEQSLPAPGQGPGHRAGGRGGGNGHRRRAFERSRNRLLRAGRAGVFRALAAVVRFPWRLCGDRGRSALAARLRRHSGWRKWSPAKSAAKSARKRTTKRLGRELADRLRAQVPATFWTSSPRQNEGKSPAGRAHHRRDPAAGSGGCLAGAIAEAGGTPLVFPLLEIFPAADPGPLVQAAGASETTAWPSSTSPNAVAHALPPSSPRGWPAQLIPAAVGQGTVKSLAGAGVGGCIAPSERFDSEALLDLPIFRLNGWPGAQLPSSVAMAAGNCLPTPCVSVERKSIALPAIAVQHPPVVPKRSAKAWHAGQLDALTVSSSEGLRYLVDMIGFGEDRRFLEITPLSSFPMPALRKRQEPWGCSR